MNLSFLKKYNAWVLFFLVAAIVSLVWVYYAGLSKGWSDTQWGLFGDKFGALNTLFTGFAFAGLVATLFYQQVQIKDAKDDVDRVIKALGGTAVALNSQAALIQRGHYLDGLKVRIDIYQLQMDAEAVKNGMWNHYRTRRQLLLKELDTLLGDVRAAAGGREIT